MKQCEVQATRNNSCLLTANAVFSAFDAQHSAHTCIWDEPFHTHRINNIIFYVIYKSNYDYGLWLLLV